MFAAPVKAILSFAAVGALSDVTHGPHGPQREQKEARVQAIAKFIKANKGNTIPTAIILAFAKERASFHPNSTSKVGTLRVKQGKNAAATIVDGQHRLFGINSADSSIEVPVVGLLDADELECAFQFLVINNKASKVAATHTKSLLADMSGTSLAERLKDARLAFDVEGIRDVDLVNSDADSPFFQTIDWTTTPKAKRMVQATAIELALDYLGGLGISEYDDRDVRRSVFLTMWKTIRADWKSLWKKDCRLISKVGIICLTRFVADLITSWADSDELNIQVTALDEIEDQTRKIIQHMDVRFWTTPWAEKAQGGFDTNQGRDRVLQAITQLFRNGKRNIPWYTDIDIIDRSAAQA
jgi:DGQHR domain-containing protein